MPAFRLHAAAALALAAGAILVGSAHAAAPNLYVDSLGDSKTAPDITLVSLTDNGDGTMSGDIALTGGISGNEIVYLAFDTDGNSADGLNGAEYVALMSLQASALARWDGNSLTPFKALPSTFDAGQGILHFTFATADIGGVTTFMFWAGSLNGDDADHAPDQGEFTYPRAAAPAAPAAPTIRSIAVVASSLFPKAGRAYVVAQPKVRLTDDTLVAPDSAACTLTWKGKALKPTHTCAWKLPLAVRHRHLLLKLSVTYHGETRTITLPVVPG
jgi:hypothetical protein